ncbi:hypothetical protein L6R29_14420 [Myxococcota bacterium]|nr:hypothetical protein [Myxococcota bacterium]
MKPNISQNRRHLAISVVLLSIFLVWWQRPSPPPKTAKDLPSRQLRILRAATPSPITADRSRSAPPQRPLLQPPINRAWQAQLRKSIRQIDREMLKTAEYWGRFPDGSSLVALRQPHPPHKHPHAERPAGFKLWRASPRSGLAPISLDLEVGTARIDPKHGRIVAVTPHQEILISAPDGKEPFTSIGQQSGYFPSWKEDGSQLLFSQKQDMISQSLQIYDLQSKAIRQLLAQEPGLAQPIWSPRGDAVIFISTRTGIASLWRLDLSQTTPRQITNQGLSLGQGLPAQFVPPPHLGRILWAGYWLVYDSGDALWAVHDNGQSQRKLADSSPLRFQWTLPGQQIQWISPPNQPHTANLPNLP